MMLWLLYDAKINITAPLSFPLACYIEQNLYIVTGWPNTSRTDSSDTVNREAEMSKSLEPVLFSR